MFSSFVSFLRLLKVRRLPPPPLPPPSSPRLNARLSGLLYLFFFFSLRRPSSIFVRLFSASCYLQKTSFYDRFQRALRIGYRSRGARLAGARQTKKTKSLQTEACSGVIDDATPRPLVLAKRFPDVVAARRSSGRLSSPSGYGSGRPQPNEEEAEAAAPRRINEFVINTEAGQTRTRPSYK